MHTFYTNPTRNLLVNLDSRFSLARYGLPRTTNAPGLSAGRCISRYAVSYVLAADFWAKIGPHYPPLLHLSIVQVFVQTWPFWCKPGFMCKAAPRWTGRRFRSQCWQFRKSERSR